MDGAAPEHTLLKLEKVSRKYGEKWALHPLNLSIAGGEFLTVLGPNGAGKSTLLKLISQQTKASGGTIYYRGQKLGDLGADYRKRLGVISHQPFLYEGLSAFENLRFYASLYNVSNPAERAREMLKKVGMGKRMNDAVRNYSRGMLQRTSIARALLHDPEIIFLDEPYTGLDRQASYMLTDILREQLAKNTTIVLVTHDLMLGYQLASTILMLSRGRQVFYGSKESAPADFEHFYLERVESGQALAGGAYG